MRVARWSILVCSQHEAHRAEIRNSLRGAGFEGIEEISSLAEAIGELKRHRIGCAIVCEELEDVPGIQAIPLLRVVDPSLRMIFVASASDPALELEAREHHVFYYHIAGENTADLVEAVASAVGPPRIEPPRPATILVVDDDSVFVDAVRAILELRGYGVIAAGSAAAGLELARSKRPDVIVVDIIMDSATDGLHYCEQARHDPVLKHTPIIAMSAASSDGVPFQLVDGERSLRVDLYFGKPFDPAAFVKGIQELLGRGE